VILFSCRLFDFDQPLPRPIGLRAHALISSDRQTAHVLYPRVFVNPDQISHAPHIPRNILAFTVTKPMFARLCSLDERSFLFKPFLRKLKKARGGGL